MGNILKGAFSEKEKRAKLMENGQEYIELLIDQEIASFIADNDIKSFNQYNLYAYIYNNIYAQMRNDFYDIILEFEGSSHGYILSLTKQRIEEYRGKVRNILDDFKKRA